MPVLLRQYGAMRKAEIVELNVDLDRTKYVQLVSLLEVYGWYTTTYQRVPYVTVQGPLTWEKVVFRTVGVTAAPMPMVVIGMLLYLNNSKQGILLLCNAWERNLVSIVSSK